MEQENIFFTIILILIIYFIPAFIGHNKKQSNGIILLNLLLGWTILGWVAALIWAVSSDTVKKEWVYTCKKCGLKTTYEQKISTYVCPNCKTETHYKQNN